MPTPRAVSQGDATPKQNVWFRGCSSNLNQGQYHTRETLADEIGKNTKDIT
ncbi:hypothetical protein Bpfe_012837, partial [Biomphalaria pfeifferi]